MVQSNFQDIEKKYKEAICEISNTGPNYEDYHFLNNFFKEIQNLRNENLISNEDFLTTRDWFSGSMSSSDTLQGHVCVKPYGYDGDFEMIDKIYQNHISQDEKNRKWDIFFHRGDAPQAVRNRKDFFIKVLNQLKPNSKVLNLACGPCRDILEYSMNNDTYLEFDNIDIDCRATKYAKELLKDVSSVKCKFQNVNIFRFMPEMKYDLIWSAGLFDYFDDDKFQRLLERFTKYIKPDGKLIIGNFSPVNNSKAYMEYGNWYLNHRSEDELLTLAKRFEHLSSVVEYEPLKVNLFLRLS